MERLLTRPVLIFLAVLAAALAVVSVVQTVRLSGEQVAHAHTKGEVVKTLSEISEKTRKAEVAAQRARDTYVTNTAENAIRHAEGVTDAYEKGLAAARSLLAGDSRLQEHWRGCPASDAGGNASDPERDQVLARRRAESAGRVFGIGATADNDYAYLFAEYMNTRSLLAACYAKPPE